MIATRMGSPLRSRHTPLHCSEAIKMRHESSSLEPCIDASPSKEEKKMKKLKEAGKKTYKRISSISSTSSPKSETNSQVATASPRSSIHTIGSSQSAPPKARSALHESHSNHHHDKTSIHSAASSRTRRPFFLPRLSSSAGSKQRRQRKRELKEKRRLSQTDILEGRHEEEAKTGSRSSLSPRGDSMVSPSSTVHSSKSNASGGKRRRGKQAIKVIRRALSSPPIMLQRFGSNPDQRGESSEGSWQESSNRSRRILPSSSSSSNSNSSSCDLNLNVAERTRVVPVAYSPAAKTKRSEDAKRKQEEEEREAVTNASCSATSILHHSYLPVLEHICGSPKIGELKRNNMIPPADREDIRNRYLNASCLSISEDPTVQESIECIFASQLEDGLKLWDEEYDDDDEVNGDGDNNFNGPRGVRSFESLERVSSSNREDLVSPANVQQSRMNRKDRKDSSQSLLFANMSQTKKRYEQASLVYVGTFDPNTPKNRVPSGFGSTRSYGTSKSLSYFSDEACCVDASTVYSNLPTDPLPCACATSFLPSVEPKDWPQAPLALRPTPGRGMKIKAIRFSNSSEPLWVPGSHLTWSQRLEQHWGRQTEEELRKKRDLQPHYACCEECIILPFNNGNEKPGEALVVDFESELFEGTFLCRLRHTNGTTPEPYDDEKGYFKGLNRRYQVCIRGRFKYELPFTELTTGFRLDRKFGKLPSKWVLKGALKVVSFFAPQLDLKMDGVEKPYSKTPLGSTPQCINVDDKEDEEDSKTGGYSIISSSSDEEKTSYTNTIEESNVRMNLLDGVRVESSEAHRSLLGIAANSGQTTSLQRARMRKKAFDKLYAQKSPDPKTDPSKIYTFEFLQHMVNFQDFSIELGSMLGSIKLEETLDGQPLPIMAYYGDKTIWSFDCWHECLWEQAQKYDACERKSRSAADNV